MFGSGKAREISRLTEQPFLIVKTKKSARGTFQVVSIIALMLLHDSLCTLLMLQGNGKCRSCKVTESNLATQIEWSRSKAFPL
jgi:hypothetical protein